MSFEEFPPYPVKDFIFPIGCIVNNMFVLHGTAFSIGDAGFLITAAHVAEALQQCPEPVAVVFRYNQPIVEPLTDFEVHDREDVAVIKTYSTQPSVLSLNRSVFIPGHDYDSWGYPENAAHEIRRMTDDPVIRESGIMLELIYTRGYIRRRISRELQIFYLRGKAFYELSQDAGSCCSGSPILTYPRTPDDPLDVIGVYVGENTAGRPNVGYAVRSEAFSHWTPKLIGQRLHDLPVAPRARPRADG